MLFRVAVCTDTDVGSKLSSWQSRVFSFSNAWFRICTVDQEHGVRERADITAFHFQTSTKVPMWNYLFGQGIVGTVIAQIICTAKIKLAWVSDSQVEMY